MNSAVWRHTPHSELPRELSNLYRLIISTDRSFHRSLCCSTPATGSFSGHIASTPQPTVISQLGGNHSPCRAEKCRVSVTHAMHTKPTVAPTDSAHDADLTARPITISGQPSEHGQASHSKASQRQVQGKKGKMKHDRQRNDALPRAQWEHLPKELAEYLRARDLPIPPWLSAEKAEMLRSQFLGYGPKTLEGYGISSIGEYVDAWYSRNMCREAMQARMTSPETRSEDKQAVRNEYAFQW